MNDWQILLYPLGFLSSLAFGSRFMLQWIYSEYRRASVMTDLFWRLSLLGNISLLFHALIQQQVHICLIQTCNAAMAWRNLNLEGPKEKRWQFHSILLLLISLNLGALIIFASTSYLSSGELTWMRIPQAPWQNSINQTISPFWHLLGFIGVTLFALRFWIQWWNSEHHGQSVVRAPFWWLSLAGGLMTLTYSIHIQDTVNILGPLFGLIPYIRNLILLRQSHGS